MDSNKSLLFAALALCAILNAAETGSVLSSDLAAIEGEPGEVDREIVVQYTKYKTHIENGEPIDKQFLKIGKDLVEQLTKLSDNPKATRLLLYTHEWNCVAYLKAKLLVEAAIEQRLFENLCSKNGNYCSMLHSSRLFKSVQSYMDQYEDYGILGIENMQSKMPPHLLLIETDKALKKYIKMLGPAKSDDFDVTLRKLYLELLDRVEKAHKNVSGFLRIFVPREQKA